MAQIMYENANAQNVSALVVGKTEGTAVKVSQGMFDTLKSNPTIPVLLEGNEGAYTVKACTAQTATSIVYDTITVTVAE